MNKHPITFDNSADMQRLLRVEEVAALLNISLPFAYRLMQRRQIPTVKFGRVVRVRLEDLKAYLEQNLQQ